MIKSKGWNWNIVTDDKAEMWKNPSIESYYLLYRWKSQGKNTFLDLGCGLGRNSILFGNIVIARFCFIWFYYYWNCCTFTASINI